MRYSLFVLANLLALARGWSLPGPSRGGAAEALPVTLPPALQQQDLQRLPLSATEQRFAQSFPGRIARYTDGNREIIVRSVQTATRQLHPAADCFRGLGYSVTPAKLHVDTGQRTWRCFEAQRGTRQKQICERIEDPSGRSWTDTSAWYWDAVLGRSVGPWWATTVATDG